jgi:uncharacterized membrane protein
MAKRMPTERELLKIERTLKDERREVGEIEQEIRLLEEKLLEKRPSHFSKRDVVNAFFASLIIGFTIILKGRVVDIALNLTATHIIALVIGTCAILYAEIYYVGYTRVRPEEHRRLGQFMAKRFFTFYGVSVTVAFGLTYLLGIDRFIPTFAGVLKLVALVSMPCAAGAAIPSMLKQF